MSRTNILELRINNLPLISFSWQYLQKPSIKPLFIQSINQSMKQTNQSNYFSEVKGRLPASYTTPSLPKWSVQLVQKTSEGSNSQ